MTELMPLEELEKQQLPSHLSGEKGTNRSVERPQIPATNDQQAIACWLSEYRNSPNTLRNYRKEVERFYLWAIFNKQKALSSIESTDLLEYGRFLKDPQPTYQWCGLKSAHRQKRWSEGWRPFIGPLSDDSKDVALRIIDSMYDYLVNVGYLLRSPFNPIRRQIKESGYKSLEQQQIERRDRTLDLTEWYALQDALSLLQDSLVKTRLRWMIALFYCTAMRVHEAANHGMRNFFKVHDPISDKEYWGLFLIGKGKKGRVIPVNQFLLSELVTYRRAIGLTEYPEKGEQEPLIRALISPRPVSDRRLNQMLDELAEKAASLIENKYPDKAERLRKVSIHWLRHLSLSMLKRLRIDKTYSKKIAGHSDDKTHEIYQNEIDYTIYQEMEKLTFRPFG